MKVNNWTLAIVCVTVVFLVGIVAVLTGLGKDPTNILSMIATVLIPSAISLIGARQAGKANENAQQAVQNTNGRMSHLVSIIEAALGPGAVPPDYDNVSRVPVNVTPITPVDVPATPQEAVYHYPGAGEPSA